MRTVVFVFFLISNYVSLFGQEYLQTIDKLKHELARATDPERKVDIYNALSDAYYQAPDRQTSCPVYTNLAILEAEKIGYDKGLAFAYHRKGRLVYIQSNDSLAADLYVKALSYANLSNDIRAQAVCLNSLGLLHSNHDHDRQKGFGYLQRAEKLLDELNDEYLTATVLGNLSRYYQKVADQKQLAVYLQKLLNLLTKVKSEEIKAAILVDIAQGYWTFRNFSLSGFYFDKASEIYAGIDSTHSMLCWTNSRSVISHFYKGNFANVDEPLFAALRVAKLHFGDHHHYTNQVLTMISVYYFKIGAYAKAIETLRDIPHTLNKRISIYLDIEVTKNYLTGMSYLKLGQLHKAEEAFKSLSAVHSEFKLHNHIALFAQSCLAYAKGDYKGSIELADKAILSLKDEKLDQITIRLIITLDQKNKSYNALYEKTNNKAYLFSSMNMIREGIELINHLKEGLLQEVESISPRDYIDNEEEFYVNASVTAAKLFGITKDHQYLNEAFKILEIGKNYELNSSLHEGTAKEIVGLPDSIIQAQTSIDEQLIYCQSMLIGLHNDPNRKNERAFWKNQHLDLLIQKQKLILSLKETHPKYFKYKFGTQWSTTLTEVRSVLSPSQAIVQYEKHSSGWFAFLITSDTVEFIKVTDRPLDDLIMQFNSAIKLDDKESYIASGVGLYKSLIEPLCLSRNSGINRLIIIPSSSLWNVNFDLLLTTDPNGPKYYHQLPYLLNDYAISYAYSCTFLSTLKAKEMSGKYNKLLALSFNDQSESATGYFDMEKFRGVGESIPGTSLEVKAISEIMDGEYYFGQMVTENLFKEMAPKYSIIHLALHGAIDFDNPDKSKLVFKLADSLEDGQLYAFELSSLNLTSDLAVLGACFSGAGKYTEEEGSLSLGRAFCKAGAKSVLLSMWELSDATSPPIMRQFYKELRMGASKDIALQQAKLEFLSRSDNVSGNPRLWGSLFILGDSCELETITQSTRQPYWLLLVGLLFITIVTSVVYRNSKRRS